MDAAYDHPSPKKWNNIPMITSTSNAKIKLIRALQTQTRERKNKAAFVAEGVRLVEEAFAVQYPIDFILFDDSLSDRGKTLINNFLSEDVEVYETTPSLIADISDTETPQGILAVLKQKALPLPQSPTFVIIADQIRDPGNMGTLLRTAEACGAEAVLLSSGTVDAYSPKVIRGAMGAHFHLPIQPLPWHEIHSYLKDLPVFLAESGVGMSLWEADLHQPCALLVGGEAYGASPLGEELATHRVSIPMAGRAESLNAAVAAAILMAEVMRQRYHHHEES